MKDGTYKLNRTKTRGFDEPIDDSLDHATPRTGYWVAQFHGTDVLINASLQSTITRYTVLHMLRWKSLDTHVGVWTDKNGNKHLDYSEHCNDLMSAVILAETRGQLAIWDIEAGKEVLL